MASVMTGIAETGITNPKFVRRRLSDGAFWSTVSSAFESYNAANIANYGIVGVETGVTGIYTATDPAETISGDYLMLKAAGANLVVSDLTTGIRWQEKVTVISSTLDSAQAEPTGVPAANATPAEKIGWLYKALRNRLDVTNLLKKFYNDDGSVGWQKALSDDNTTYTEAEAAAP